MRERCLEVMAEGGAALPVGALGVENMPGTPRSPRRATERTTVLSTRRPTLSGASDRRAPSITSVLTASGLRTASTRASSPPRLCPITTARRPVRFQRASAGGPQGARSLAPPQSTFNRIPADAVREPRRRSHPRSSASECVAGHEPGHEQNGRWRRSAASGRRNGGIADAGAQARARSEARLAAADPPVHPPGRAALAQRKARVGCASVP